MEVAPECEGTAAAVLAYQEIDPFMVELLSTSPAILILAVCEQNSAHLLGPDRQIRAPGARATAFVASIG